MAGAPRGAGAGRSGEQGAERLLPPGRPAGLAACPQRGRAGPRCGQSVGKAQAQGLHRCARREGRRAALKGQRHRVLWAAQDGEAAEDAPRFPLARRFPELTAAWQPREALCGWSASVPALKAPAGLDAWMAAVPRTGPAELVQVRSGWRSWREDILVFLAFLPPGISKGFVEGKNKRTKALMRQAYGDRNHQPVCLRMRLEVA